MRVSLESNIFHLNHKKNAFVQCFQFDATREKYNHDPLLENLNFRLLIG